VKTVSIFGKLICNFFYKQTIKFKATSFLLLWEILPSHSSNTKWNAWSSIYSLFVLKNNSTNHTERQFSTILIRMKFDVKYNLPIKDQALINWSKHTLPFKIYRKENKISKKSTRGFFVEKGMSCFLTWKMYFPNTKLLKTFIRKICLHLDGKLAERFVFIF
jgi:hypothetical protein